MLNEIIAIWWLGFDRGVGRYSSSESRLSGFDSSMTEGSSHCDRGACPAGMRGNHQDRVRGNQIGLGQVDRIAGWRMCDGRILRLSLIEKGQ